VRVWIIQIGERHRETDGDVKLWRSVRLSKTLHQRGHEVTFITSTFDHFQKKHRYNVETTIKSELGFNLVFLHSRFAYKKNISARRLFQQIDISTKFKKYAEKHLLPDIIICALPTIELTFQAAKICSFGKTKLVIDIRDLWPDIYFTSLPIWMHLLGKIVFQRDYAKIRFALHNASAILAVSEKYLKWGKDLTKIKNKTICEVVPIGADSPKIIYSRFNQKSILNNYKIFKDNVVITYVGSFGKSYDLTTLVKAFNKLTTYPKARLVLVGDGDNMNSIKQLAKQNNRIILTGWQKASICNVILKRTDIAVAAYAPDALQSLPNKVFEYMAFGLPTLSSLTGEFHNIIEKCKIGLNYNAGNADQLFKVMQKLVGDKKLRVAYGKNAQNLHREKYSSNKVDVQYANIIQRAGMM
jgi:glycosyltransferase involved in cell wall biosynthesis